MPKVLALINARQGSKGIPGKNIKPLGGRPLIAWSVETAKEAGCFSRIVVSTDGADIAAAARAAGADVPFMRPAALATDDSPQIDTVMHAVDWLEQNEKSVFDYIFLLQPTSPFRSTDDITGVLDLLISSGADSVITVVSAGHAHPSYMYTLGNDGQAQPLQPQGSGSQRQGLTPVYIRSGALYAMKRDVLRQRTLYGSRVHAYIIDQERALNIDDALDWEFAEFLTARRRS